ncbi:MAG: ThuA domain-containing protein [Deltaproteobacteria bacterium]|nr:ThuA domain-containing protein [Deltaproteobacteria bacterium]
MGIEPDVSVIVFTGETLWMHPSNPVAGRALIRLGTDQGWKMAVTSDPGVFTPERLAVTDAVVFAVTSGEVLDDPARAALEVFFTAGGGFVGIHSASATEMTWPFYTEKLVPVRFRTHPYPNNVLPGRLTHESEHPILADLPNPWQRTDEFYTFQERPEDLGLTLLLALDESSMGPDYTSEFRVGYHPIAFTHERSGGRTFYTALGHTPESYAEPEFLMSIESAIAWVSEPRHATRASL